MPTLGQEFEINLLKILCTAGLFLIESYIRMIQTWECMYQCADNAFSGKWTKECMYVCIYNIYVSTYIYK